MMIDLVYSAIGIVGWIVAIVVWLSVFHTQRRKMGIIGERLTVVIPNGE